MTVSVSVQGVMETAPLTVPNDFWILFNLEAPGTYNMVLVGLEKYLVA